MALINPMNNIKPLYDAIKQHTKQYDSGDTDYSVTTLQDPPRIVQLERRHGHKVPFTVEGSLASFMGTAIHEYMEKMLIAGYPDIYKLEERLGRTVLNRKTTGAYDIFMTAENELFDIKTSKTYNYLYNDRKHWTAQQNMYRSFIREKHGIKLKKLNIIFWGWEWSKYTMMQNKGYPRQQVVLINLPLWSDTRVHDYMEERVQMMIDSESLSDVDLPLCSREDMWADDDVFAVHHRDKKKALRLQPSYDTAKDWMNNYQQESQIPISKLYVDTRPGKRKRCEDWCGINNYCNQYTDYCSMKGK